MNSQVVGTVLALNGWRLYFSMYHPKHAPSMEGYREPQRTSASAAARGLGLDADDDDDSDDQAPR